MTNAKQRNGKPAGGRKLSNPEHGRLAILNLRLPKAARAVLERQASEQGKTLSAVACGILLDEVRRLETEPRAPEDAQP